MNQHHWTCLTTVFLTTALAPIGNVHAKNLPSPAVGSVDKHFSLSRRSVPISPLTVTRNVNESGRISHQGNLPPENIHSYLPSSKLIATRQVFNSNWRSMDATQRSNPSESPVSQLHRTRNLKANVPTPATTRPLFKQSIDQTIVTPTPVIRPDGSKSTIVNKTTVRAEIAYAAQRSRSSDSTTSQPRLNRDVNANISTPVTTPSLFKQSIDQTIVTPTSVIRADGSKSTIVNATTVRAEIANPAQVKIARASQTAPAPKFKRQMARVIDRSEIALTPQATPVATRSNNRPKISRFEAGLPQYIFDNGRPQQIVSKTIAQVGTETGSSESSVSIPVQQPDRRIIPTQIPTTNGAIGTKTEQPTDKAQSALDQVVATQTGKASWYGSEAGSKTANGERYDPSGLTAAHRTLPFGTKVRVTSLTTGKMVVVRINDRGPVNDSRIIDVSAGAAAAIGIKDRGVGTVRMEVLSDKG
jgi:rare lipoprotein A